MSLILNGTTGISDVDGTAAAPALTGTDSNTGIFFPAADTIAFAEGGAEAMRIDSSGNVGIGTTANFSNGSGVEIQRAGVATLRVDNSTSTAAGEFRADETGTAIDCRGLEIFRVLTGGTERARIDSSGNLLVGKTSANLAVVGTEVKPNGYASFTMASSTNSLDTLNVYSSTANLYRFYVGLAGTVFATNTAITAISDQRLKENIRDLDDGLQKVMALQPRKFDWKEGKGADIKDARGFIAQEFEIVFPDMVEEWKDTPPEGEEPYKAVNANLIPTLVKAIQEQQALITALTARITALESSTLQ